jgi:hypothetical protein
MTRTQPGKLAPRKDEPAVADDDEDTNIRREEWAGPAGQPQDTERALPNEEEAHLRSHHLETSGSETPPVTPKKKG